MRKSLCWLPFLLFVSCKHPSQIDQVLQLAGKNRSELEKVLLHYKTLGDERKFRAAEFLISNIGYNKFSYDGEILQHYDTVFHLYDSLRNASVIVGDPPVVTKTWNYIVEKHGEINPFQLNKIYDYKNITADFLIQNIDHAFLTWEKSPLYNPEHFDSFCEYILPYRVQNEPYEEYRQRYYDSLKHIVDTAQSVRGIIHGFHLEMRWNRHYRPSDILWNYPVEFPVSKMEIGRRGACRHLTTYTALYMRSCGLPVTIDRAIWANRDQGHSWNVLIIDDKNIFPFDALGRDSIKFAYKPAKIFRKTYSSDLSLKERIKKDDVPYSFFLFDEKDVTNEYCKTYNVNIPIRYPQEVYKNKKQAVICVFDNKWWHPVYWGDIKSEEIVFQNMPADVAYIGAYYDKGEVIPITELFILNSQGEVRFLKANKDSLLSLCLERKYPRFRRIEDHAWGMRRTNAEGSNDPQFNNFTKFFSVYDIPFHVADSVVEDEKKYRYVRFNSSTYRNANFAEVEFYGKKHLNDKEEKLSGKIIGYPPVREDDENSYTQAMDGNLETYFFKDKDNEGWVGLDLGQGNEHIITRVRFCPRSDTNFILKGDEYELLYWDKEAWQSLGKKKALQYNFIEYNNVPSGTVYLLRNHTRGKEERIFTYENGKQVWL